MALIAGAVSVVVGTASALARIAGLIVGAPFRLLTALWGGARGGR